jgi:hypothetical protein
MSIQLGQPTLTAIVLHQEAIDDPAEPARHLRAQVPHHALAIHHDRRAPIRRITKLPAPELRVVQRMPLPIDDAIELAQLRPVLERCEATSGSHAGSPSCKRPSNSSPLSMERQCWWGWIVLERGARRERGEPSRRRGRGAHLRPVGLASWFSCWRRDFGADILVGVLRLASSLLRGTNVGWGRRTWAEPFALLSELAELQGIGWDGMGCAGPCSVRRARVAWSQSRAFRTEDRAPAHALG